MTKKNDHLRPGLFSESVFSTIIFPDRPDPDSLEGLQLTINEKSDETLECTRRMREMCAEAKDAGMKTLIALDDQEVNTFCCSSTEMATNRFDTQQAIPFFKQHHNNMIKHHQSKKNQ